MMMIMMNWWSWYRLWRARCRYKDVLGRMKRYQKVFLITEIKLVVPDRWTNGQADTCTHPLFFRLKAIKISEVYLFLSLEPCFELLFLFLCSFLERSSFEFLWVIVQSQHMTFPSDFFSAARRSKAHFCRQESHVTGDPYFFSELVHLNTNQWYNREMAVGRWPVIFS